MVSVAAFTGEAAKGTNREGHRDLAERLILGVGRSNRKARCGEMVVFGSRSTRVNALNRTQHSTSPAWRTI